MKVFYTLGSHRRNFGKMLMTAALLGGLTAPCLAQTDEEALQFIEDGVRGCSNVTLVQRDSSSLSVGVQAEGATAVVSLDVGAVQSSAYSDGSIVLKCITGGCVKFKFGAQSSFTNQLQLVCGTGMNDRMSSAFRFYGDKHGKKSKF